MDKQTARGRWERGLRAMVAWWGIVLVARFALTIVTPVEVVYEFTGRLLGVPWVFNLVHRAPWGLDMYVKYVLFGLVTIAFVVGLGGLTVRLQRTTRSIGRAAIAAVAAVLVLGLGLLPGMGLGVFGLADANRAWPVLPLHASLAFATFVWSYLAMSVRTDTTPVDVVRRRVTSSIAVGVAMLPLGVGAAVRGFVANAQALGRSLFDAVQGLVPMITPTQDHYVVAKGLFAPRVNAARWNLELGGLVDRPQRLDLPTLQSLPSVTRPSTLMCISNPVGGTLIGTSVWTGVRLRDLMDLAGVSDEANEVVLWGADNYGESFPIDAAMREGTIVAFAQNGEPLTASHGAPARVLVPGIYGMKNVKWVERIEFVREDYRGYWQERGWSDVAIIKTMSRIDTDVATELGDGRWAIGGIAYAGLRGIAAVQVSVDRGGSWIDALVEPAANELSWNRWAVVLDAGVVPTVVGASLEVRVRAADGSGAVQTDVVTQPLPDGASGHHRVMVRTPS